LSLIASEIKPEQIVEINIHNNIETNFPVLDVFVKVAAHICRGGKLEVIGKLIPEIQQIKNLEPIISSNQNQILGHIIYIDHYGNVVSNVTKKRFNEIGKGRKFDIVARNIHFKKVYNSYSEAINFDEPKEKREEEGKKIALFNVSGYLELAIYKSNPFTVGSAASLFGLKLTNNVTINFENENTYAS
jgi:S-adenosylmethionine hydrolase